MAKERLGEYAKATGKMVATTSVSDYRRSRLREIGNPKREIITPILGRSIDPTKYFTGETSFNSHLGKAEHLVLDDPKWSGKAKKDDFVAHLKGVIANEEETLHPKGKEEFKPRIFRRVTISINDEEEPMSIPSADTRVYVRKDRLYPGRWV